MKGTPYYTDQWYVSPWDYYPEVTKNFKINPKVKIHDVTLREGEQAPGVVFDRNDKLAIAKKLAELGVDRIEGGMPAVSQEDEYAMKAIVDANLGPEIFAFCRCMVGDIEKAHKCGCKGAILEISCNPIFVEKAVGKDMAWAKKAAIEATIAAKELGMYTGFFTIDGTRTEVDYLLDTVDEIKSAGHMDAFILADTFGCVHPQAVYPVISKVKQRFPGIPVEAHMHMHFGLGAANTLAAITAGADVAHVSISGIGEGCGNTPLEDVAMSLKCLYGVNTNIKTEKLCEVSKFVCGLADNHTLPPNRPIVGERIMTVESGMGFMFLDRAEKNNAMDVIMTYQPQLVGQPGLRYVLGKKSGLASVQRFLKMIGKTLNEEQQAVALEKIKTLGIRKKSLVTIEEFEAIVNEVSNS
jgi:isopropylmalate/homocitrate/citramalate synthase